MKYSFLLKNLSNAAKKSISSSLHLNLSQPLQVIIQPNERCNARCLMCDCWKEKDDYIDYKEIIDALEQLRKWVGPHFFVQIAGGEPLIYKGIYDIFSYCAANGIICKISTNGIALTENVCDKIIASKLPYLSVSMDSHLPQIHDKYRGVDGTLERAVKGINYLAANGNLTLGISSVLMKENISTLADSVDFFLSLPIDRLLMQPIGVWTESLPPERWHEYEYWVNDHEAVAKFTDYLLEKKKSDKRILNTEQDIREWREYFVNPAAFANNSIKKCTNGYDRLTIDYKGNVFLGCRRFSAVGNIKDNPLKETWHSPKAKKVREQMMSCRFPCTANCNKRLTLPQKVSKAFVLLKSGLFDKK